MDWDEVLEDIDLEIFVLNRDKWISFLKYKKILGIFFIYLYNVYVWSTFRYTTDRTC